MEKSVAILNFDECYVWQDFYREISPKWIDFTKLSGVKGYCEEEAKEKIKEILKKEEIDICYIGSGNYHYITLFLLEKLNQPFTLVLFDHHTDMKPSLFGDLLSCGSWVKWALDKNKNLKEVILIGVSDSFLDTIEPIYRERIFIWEETKLKKTNWESIKKQIQYPVYLSIDKDVFSKKEVITDWDQGSLEWREFEEVYKKIKETKPILGIDICGEFDKSLEEENQKNSRINKKILELIKEY